ncbi:hypothetical protein SPTER_48790 (plasmid) [Sporomusa termitida]|uniref:Uncharacterized protein n=2 Tax=Sporomusa termitida TaxID=2377 RepID=A0A517E1B6_9FIRM|nr:hypothetical protein SPTER_48790 [Sporomusa termitida]
MGYETKQENSRTAHAKSAGKNVGRRVILLCSILMVLSLTAGVTVQANDRYGNVLPEKTAVSTAADNPETTGSEASQDSVSDMLEYFESQGATCELPKCETDESPSSDEASPADQ